MLSSFRILVIEDEAPIRQLIQEILTSENYEVIEAENGERGLQSVFRDRPDLILCDVMMPGMDGYEVLRELQRYPAIRSIPFIFLTAKATREETRRGMNAGADDYIIKPFDEDELLGAIGARLRKNAEIRSDNDRGREKNVDPLITLENRDRPPIVASPKAPIWRSPDRSPLETELIQALDREWLAVYYQPQISIGSREITGAEALVRWPHPDRGLIPPNEFIPIAEKNGSIERLGAWVLRSACEQWTNWHSLGLKLPRLSVNLSARQFEKERFQDDLTAILQTTGIPPRALELELTEGTLIQNIRVATRRFNTLRELGVKIAIDDFGTGYSSLSYLNQLSFDTLKIDRVFVKDIDRNPKNAAIVRALILMAHQLGLTVIAEGVEKEEEVAFLRANHCDEIQGFLFSPPVPATDFEKLLRNSAFDRSGYGLENRPER
ncbi:EAL domain-containing response regulator [Pannus brasiliensis CCIBt3594]|uniref:EAL domain-containing response regulator n=1 Tax=Pannus brasiliensis CCIBt3594 TaxID=1427578 RepID=A0AAW9QVN8_9CHRO